MPFAWRRFQSQREEREEHKVKADAENAGRQDESNRKKIVESLERIAEAHKASDKRNAAEHKRNRLIEKARFRQERRKLNIDRGALIIAALVMVLFIGQDVLLWTQHDDTIHALQKADEANSISKNTFVMTERPWMQGGFRFTSPITISNDGLRTSVEFALYNSGKSPARHVWGNMELITARKDVPTTLKEEQGVCNTNKLFRISEPVSGVTVFPNDTARYTEILGVPKEDMDNAIRVGGIISILLIACIEYTYDFSDDIHETSYIRNLVMDGPSGDQKGIEPAFGTIDPNRVHLTDIIMMPGRAT